MGTKLSRANLWSEFYRCQPYLSITVDLGPSSRSSEGPLDTQYGDTVGPCGGGGGGGGEGGGMVRGGGIHSPGWRWGGDGM